MDVNKWIGSWNYDDNITDHKRDIDLKIEIGILPILLLGLTIAVIVWRMLK